MGKHLSATVFIFIFFCCASAFAQSNAGVFNFEAEGNAAINQNDIAAARDGAVQSALQRAILEAISVLLPLSVKDEKFLPVKNEIIEKQDKYINNYKITTENKQTETYFVTVNVAVELSSLKNDLAKRGFLSISDEEKNDIVVLLNVNGIKGYSDFLYLKEFLKKRTKIVKSIYPRSFKWQQAHLEIRISGSVRDLADELAGTGRYLLEDEQVNNGQITISLLQ